MTILIKLEIIPAEDTACDSIDVDVEIVGRDPIYASEDERRLIVKALHDISQPFEHNDPTFKFKP